MNSSGYLDTPWPCEDGGPQRLQIPRAGAGLNLRAGEKLSCVTRNTLVSTMTLLGAPGEAYLLTHTAIRDRFGLPGTARVDMIDPHTLKTVRRSPRLAGGPWWPGGMALHRNGDLYVVYGRHAHRLNRVCEPLASLPLPIEQPYNSFVILDNGLIVTKNLSDKTPARLSVIDPDWRFDYIGDSTQTFGWDVVLDSENAWFMDNGKNRYRRSMIGAGVNPTPNRLIRVASWSSTTTDAAVKSWSC